jgi:hypothetical protein
MKAPSTCINKAKRLIMSIQENFYTFEELKSFTNNFTDLNLLNLTKFVEVKTSSKYTIVTGEFIKDMNWQFLNNRTFIFDFVRLTNDKWDELVKKNEKLVAKHASTLSKFDIKEGK